MPLFLMLFPPLPLIRALFVVFSFAASLVSLLLSIVEEAAGVAAVVDTMFSLVSLLLLLLLLLFATTEGAVEEEKEAAGLAFSLDVVAAMSVIIFEFLSSS